MLDVLYEKLKLDLLATKEIKIVQVYSNQIERLTAAKNGTGVVGFPAVLIEFSNVVYKQLGDGVQEYTGVVRLHVVCYDLQDAGAKIFKAVRAVHDVAQGFYTEHSTGLVRIDMDTDNNFTNTCINIVDYAVRGCEPPIVKQMVPVKALDITVKSRYIDKNKQ